MNVHLGESWLPELEKICLKLPTNTRVHKDFRLWITSMPSKKFPVSILQTAVKITNEPPRGLRANTLRAISSVDDIMFDAISSGEIPQSEAYTRLLFSLCFFHGIILERKRFGPLGWNVKYPFNDSDLRISLEQLRVLCASTTIPFEALRYITGHVNYGGRVTDDWDRRTMLAILDDFYTPRVHEDDHSFCSIKSYKPPTDMELEKIAFYLLEDEKKKAEEEERDPMFMTTSDIPVKTRLMKYAQDLPASESPEVFGLHSNASIMVARHDTRALLQSLLAVQPVVRRKGTTDEEEEGDKVGEDPISDLATSILKKLPDDFDEVQIVRKYPQKRSESINTVLIQEVGRYNVLLRVVRDSLKMLKKAIAGIVVMSSEYEEVYYSLQANLVPVMWEEKAYPSLKPLASWVEDLLERISFIQTWIDRGIPRCFWISGFSFPQAFITGTLQNHARKYKHPIDTVSFDFIVHDEAHDDDELPVLPPGEGCYVRGLFLDGARWDYEHHQITDQLPKELYSVMPRIRFKPEQHHKPPPDTSSSKYVCPMYKTLERAGVLSTTGHSSNYILPVELPSNKTQAVWIKRGAVLVCALDD
ncbi:Dynein axonemal heavy chain 1 [Aduncisulcus paluster]|uniref:Dynein axonemal heavy chain 1 n=1 Tax=Aduncisulcus paluster TaxID=2918883 RepID=A0ABQ5JTX8_9EUKA|nr:Dynein axonemal heavy chain 1 [Aduncisulcus paluster]